MNSRQRVLKTLSFKEVDRPPYDLMEGCVWPELLDYFRKKHGIQEAAGVIDFLDPDFRWTFLEWSGPPPESPLPAAKDEAPAASTKAVVAGPLEAAETLADLEAYPWPDPSLLRPADYAAVRRSIPNKALVFCPGWMPLFWTACEAFGMEAALINLVTRPALFDAFVRRQHEIVMDILTRGAEAAAGHCDLAWLGDDFAHQGGMIINPVLWRKHIKPLLAEQVRVLRVNGLAVLFHSCGAVRPVLEDLIEIGVNALLVFQTTAKGMDAASIARDFGGRLGFYGGVDIQRLLSFGTPEEVAAEVQANCQAFEGCGGYVVANSHHSVASIRGENIEAMCAAAKGVLGQA